MIKLPKIAADKLAHYFWSRVLFNAMLYLVGYIIASIALSVVAAWKELWHDGHLSKGRKEWLDFVYSVLPIVEYSVIRQLTDVSLLNNLLKYYDVWQSYPLLMNILHR